MPGYRVRYVCETSLKFDNDVALKSRGSTILFLFSQKRPEEHSVHLLVDVEGANYRDADVKAQSILQPGLDALAFSTGSPLLVLHWDFILKDEEESNLELCWHRYALQRNLILDRFVFQWLAFEGLAGKKQIPTICPHCKAEVTHCDNLYCTKDRTPTKHTNSFFESNLPFPLPNLSEIFGDERETLSFTESNIHLLNFYQGCNPLVPKSGKLAMSNLTGCMSWAKALGPFRTSNSTYTGQICLSGKRPMPPIRSLTISRGKR
jgi:hypothetical protein